MYEVKAFREDRVEVMHALIAAHPLATLVVMTAQGLEANHIPMLVDPTPAPGREYGALRGHVARGNPLWHTFNANVEALAVFQGSQGYITRGTRQKRNTAKWCRRGITRWCMPMGRW